MVGEEVESLDMVGLAGFGRSLCHTPRTELRAQLPGRLSKSRCSTRSFCRPVESVSRGANTPKKDGRLASRLQPEVFFGTARSESKPRSFCCQRTTTIRRVRGRHLRGRIIRWLEAPVEATNPAKPHGLFLSHKISVGRETPNRRVIPRIEGRSAYARRISSFWSGL